MKCILLSADVELSVYSVPDIVSDNLIEYCTEFREWLEASPHAQEYRIDSGDYQGLCYTERDFIKYLNMWIFPDNLSEHIETLHNVWVGSSIPNDIPEKYKYCEWYNF